MSKSITLPISGRVVELKPLTTSSMMLALKKDSEIEQSKIMAMESSGLTEAEIGALDFRDYATMQREMLDFLKV